MTDRDIQIERSNIIAARFWLAIFIIGGLLAGFKLITGPVEAMPAKPKPAIVAPSPSPTAAPLPELPLDNLEELDYDNPNPTRSA